MMATEAQSKWRAANREKIRSYNHAATYGLTPSQYNTLLQEQNGVCACCGKLPVGNRRLCVDHDHHVEKNIGVIFIRGLLCDACNIGIGKLGDDVVGLRRALAYLERTK
jgi:Recombination endonuclease VII